MGDASGVAGGSCHSVPYASAAPPVVVRKNFMCPLDPSRPLSQRKVYIKIIEMCQKFKTLHRQCGISFYFRSLTAKAPAASFPQLKVR